MGVVKMVGNGRNLANTPLDQYQCDQRLIVQMEVFNVKFWALLSCTEDLPYAVSALIAGVHVPYFGLMDLCERKETYWEEDRMDLAPLRRQAEGLGRIWDY